MFSLDNFYYVLTANFLQPFRMVDAWFKKFNFESRDDLLIGASAQIEPMRCKSIVYFYDQEPIISSLFDKIMYCDANYFSSMFRLHTNRILANSEHSELKDQICKELDMKDWYYFFHGLAALEWYRDYKYLPKVDKKFSKVFITMNHLVTKDRSYRLHLVASLLEQDLTKHGLVGCQLKDLHGSWKDEILSPTSKLSKDAKKRIYLQFSKLTAPLTLDINDGAYSLCSARPNISLQQSALWHIVTETVFYYDKLHLTEKVFQPIIARRPFMLLAAPGNLRYLKSYGFKTFDRWIDESYDSETDHDRRTAMVVAELERFCQMSSEELVAVYREMEEILDFNFNHFYSNFKCIVLSEMIENFEKCIKQLDVGVLPEERLGIENFNAQEVYGRLTQ